MIFGHVKPRKGQTWRFGGASGRPDTIKSIGRGLAGKWSFTNGKLTPLLGRQTAVYVKWKSGYSTITVKQLLGKFTYSS